MMTNKELLLQTMKYEFNDKGVCSNPDVLYFTQDGYTAEIYTAQAPDGVWCFGYHCKGDGNEFGSPCTRDRCYGLEFQSQRAARREAIESVLFILYYKKHHGVDNSGRGLNHILNSAPTPQLELFPCD